MRIDWSCGAGRRNFLLTALALVAAPWGGRALGAQSAPKTYYACYVPLTGTVYRIKESDVKPACASASHVEFSWVNGANAWRVTDPAGGDLTGVLSSATVAKLLGRALGTTPPTAGQVLTFDGTAWTPTAVPGASFPAATGDLSGTYPGLTVARLQGIPLAAKEPATGQFLGFNGTVWQPTTAPSGGGVTSHGALTGLLADDHPQYLIANGVRNATDGFAVAGNYGFGAIPVTGAGTRLMWYPGKAAFRAGHVDDLEWDDSQIGLFSMAFGYVTTASGASSTALGVQTLAAGNGSTAMGIATLASGQYSTAMGANTVASGNGSTAMGYNTVASGDGTTAMGSSASTNSQRGSFVYGDVSIGIPLLATVRNQFAVRAQNFWFGTDNNVTATAGRFLETSTGAYLSSGGAWTNSSDVNRKHLFEITSSEDVLARLAAMPVQQWGYKAEDASVRHLGPTAQDFYAAFHLGASETAIATVDADGVSLLAIQALETRTRDLQVENVRLRTQLDALAAAVARLEAASRQP